MASQTQSHDNDSQYLPCDQIPQKTRDSKDSAYRQGPGKFAPRNQSETESKAPDRGTLPSPVSRKFPWHSGVRTRGPADPYPGSQRSGFWTAATPIIFVLHHIQPPAEVLLQEGLDHWLLRMYATAHILEHIYPHCIEYAETSGWRVGNGRWCQQSQHQKKGQAKKQLTHCHFQRKGGAKTVVGVPSIGDRPETGGRGWMTSHGWAQRQMGSARGPDACPFLLGLREQLSCSHRNVDNSPHVSSASATTLGCRAYASRPAW